MPPPTRTPLGLQLNRASRVVGRAFDDALAEAGGSLPSWLVMISLVSRRGANQRQLADAVGLQEATLSHHVNAMVERGLVSRERDPDNRRSHRIELTEDGEAAFARMRGAAMAFDRRLRRGLSADELVAFEATLARLTTNVEPEGGRGDGGAEA